MLELALPTRDLEGMATEEIHVLRAKASGEAAIATTCLDNAWTAERTKRCRMGHTRLLGVREGQ